MSFPIPPERDQSRLSLAKTDVLCLLAAFLSILIISVISIIYLLSLNSDVNNFNDYFAIKYLIPSSLAGSSLFYARKLYKSGINGLYNFSPDGFSLSRISSLAYYIFRIPVSVLLSLLLYCLWRISTDVGLKIAPHEYQASGYLFIIMGFLAGLSTGRLILYFEQEALSGLGRLNDENRRDVETNK